MTQLKTIDLDSVTGGQAVFSPCARFNNLPVAKATAKDLAIANRFCSVKLPTRADKEWAKHIAFATGGAQ
jgi:hypothetical protein